MTFWRISAMVLSLAATTGVSANPPTSNSLWYYELGGTNPVPPPPKANVSSLNLDGSVELGLGYSCMKFDPVVAVAHTLNQVKQGAEDMLNAMTQAASGAIASLPALILQRANPGLYDLMQNALARANLKVDVATKSCQQIEAELAAGKNPYHDLIVLSKGNSWKKQMGIGGNNVVTARTAVENDNGDSGLPWVFGASAGGSGQEPIRMTADLVAAGYNATLNRDVTDRSSASATTEQPLAQLWSEPTAAQDWIVDVIGEHEVTICPGCSKRTSPGNGLLPKLKAEEVTIKGNLDTLLLRSTPPSNTELADLKAPGIQLSRQVIDALKELPREERELIADRLGTEIAMSRILEQSIYAKRLLQTGRQVPEAEAISVVQDHAEQAIAELDAETQQLLFEFRARREVVADTVAFLLQRVEERRLWGQSIPETTRHDQSPLRDGRVIR